MIGVVAGAWAAAIVARASPRPYPLRLRFDRADAARVRRVLVAAVRRRPAAIVIAQGVDARRRRRSSGSPAVGAITLAATISLYTDRVDEIVTSTLYPAICAVKDRTDLLFEAS